MINEAAVEPLKDAAIEFANETLAALKLNAPDVIIVDRIKTARRELRTKAKEIVAGANLSAAQEREAYSASMEAPKIEFKTSEFAPSNWPWDLTK